MTDAEYEGASDTAINELAAGLRAILESNEDVDLDDVLELPEAKQAIAAWGVKHEVAALAHGGKVASWLVGALRRRGLD